MLYKSGWRMKKLFVLLTLSIIIIVSALSFSGCVQNTPDTDDKKESYMPSKCVYTNGKYLYDENGEVLTLRGTNIGNWLVPEGWMGIINIDGQNDDVDGQKLTYKKMMKAFDDNENNFSKEQIDELLDIYYLNWFTEQDVKFIKDSGFNCIRLPFGYFNVADDDGNLTDGIKWIDLCLEWCQKYQIYCILDLHGAYGSQNKDHHSGDDTQCILFENKECQRKTVKLWCEIAKRYKDNNYVLGYDLLNEPKGNTDKTVEAQHVFHNELYQAIRQIDKNHIIIIEACWQFSDFPDINRFGWENVIYEMHLYDFSDNTAKFLSGHMLVYTLASYVKDKPILIGEFWLGMQDLELAINTFEENSFGWTSWTYKTNDRGAWGMRNLKMERVNISHASFDEIAECFENSKSENAKVSSEFEKLLEILE